MATETLIIATGVPLGAEAGTPVAHGNPHALIRVAGQFLRVPVEMYELWLGRCFADGDDLSDWAAHLGLDLEEEDIDRLAALRLVLRVPTEDVARSRAVLALVRLLPVGVCRGSVAAEPWRFAVDVAYDTTLELGGVAYLIWAHSDGVTSLATVAELTAASTGLAIEQVIRSLLEEIVPTLLLSGGAYVDWMP